MSVFQIVEYDWVQKGSYMNAEYRAHTGFLFLDKEKATKEAANMNYPFSFEKYRIIETKIIE